MNGIGLEPATRMDLEHAIVSAYPNKCLIFTDKDGNPANLAIIDANGNILESGDAVRIEVEAVCLAALKQILFGKGWQRVYSPKDKATISSLANAA